MKPIGITSTLIIGILLNGCASDQDSQAGKRYYPPGTYCKNAGQVNDYDCNSPDKAPSAPMHARTVDEEWMYLKLEEIKEWLKEEKEK